MTRKLSRTVIAATVLAGFTMVGGLSASAQTSVAPGEEVFTTYYNNAQHSTVIGQRAIGCTIYAWGSTSSYITVNAYAC